MAQSPLCFVVMPFGQKADPAGGPDIDFDRIYKEALEPGIAAADMQPIRADEERAGGIIHKPMFERLLLCEYVVADLTTANANVFYELGFAHALEKPVILLSQEALPFDLQHQRFIQYANTISGAASLRDALRQFLVELWA